MGESRLIGLQMLWVSGLGGWGRVEGYGDQSVILREG